MIEMLDELAAGWSESLVRASWQGGLLIAAAWLLVRCRPGLPPRVACWIWRLADLKLIVALVWAAPLVLPLLPPLADPGPIPEPFAPAPELRPSLAGGPEPIPDGAVELAGPHATPRPSRADAALLLWLSGAIGGMTLAGRGWLAAARLRRSCPAIDRPDLRDAASELSRALGLWSLPELRAGSTVARPMLVGAFRPAILLPAAMLGDPRSIVALRPILAHELAHVRRRDLLWGILSGLVRALFFFHPLVWLAHREALLAREAACDALALGASGVRRSEYGRILLDIAAGGRERPARWAAALGMAGPAGSLRRRLIAMKSTHQPSRRRLLSWAMALLVVGAAGIIPWRLVPREVLAQQQPLAPPAKEPVRDGKDKPAPTTQGQDDLTVVEARLEVARAQRRVAEAVVAQAKAERASAVAQRQYREKQHLRMVQLDERGAVEHRLVDEERGRLLEAQAAERAAEAKIAVARASLDDAAAAAREAEAERDIARAQSRGAEAETDLKAARARLHDARLDRARAERKAALAEVDRAEAALKKAEATVAYRTKQFQRIKQLVDRASVEERLLDEEKQRLTEARIAEREAEAAVELARARVKAAEARVKAVEAEAEAKAGAAGPGPKLPTVDPFDAIEMIGGADRADRHRGAARALQK
jgi:beta-lactamase regulating signal transducer with metallopeptidase domain